MKQKMYSCDARVILSILIGLFLSCNVFAQDVTIKGNVKDAKGEPIIGASILEKGTTNGTVTDFDGNFMLSAPKGSTIGISYIGYKSQDIINQGQSNLIVVLQEDTEVLDEVVVVGYGTMKKSDFIFLLVATAIFVPFFVSDDAYEWYITFNATHGIVMSFLKFAILSTMGEMIGLRISTGVYINRTFGIIPRMVVWGLLGMGINMAMIIFSKGVPMFMEYMGMANASSTINGEMCFEKIMIALAISVAMNSIFAPVFMTLHKITDTHIGHCGGSVKALLTPIPMKRIMTELNWAVLWGFVFKKTIPLFWYPAHTITFLLPPNMRVLFAAILGIVLGVLLAVAAKKK